MPDRNPPQPPPEGTPEYDWLYGSGQGRDGAASGDDATRLRKAPFAGEPRPSRGSRSAPEEPQQTQVMPTAGGAYQTPPPPPDRASRPVSPPPPSAPPPSAPPTRRGPGRPRRRGRFGWVKVVLLLWLVFLVATPIWAWTQLTKVDHTPEGERPDDQPGTTYLLVGSDSRTESTKGTRTDTIMLLHTGNGPNLLMSIPRDSQVEIPGHGETKINAAYAYGGAPLLVETIELNTGIKIDDYVQMGFGGFVDLVDALGGVEVCPKQAIEDELAHLKIKKGCQEVNGKKALAYSRARHFDATGDIARAQNQREVVGAVGRKALSPWTVVNPVRWWRFNSAAASSVAVGEDTGPIALANFAWAMTRVNGDDGLTCVVPIADLSVRWDEERSRRLFDHIINDDTDAVMEQKGELCTPKGLL